MSINTFSRLMDLCMQDTFFKQPSLCAYFHLVVDGLLPLMEMHTTQCVEYEQKHTNVYKQTVCLKTLTCTNTESLSGPDIFLFPPRYSKRKERINITVYSEQ